MLLEVEPHHFICWVDSVWCKKIVHVVISWTRRDAILPPRILRIVILTPLFFPPFFGGVSLLCLLFPDTLWFAGGFRGSDFYWFGVVYEIEGFRLCLYFLSSRLFIQGRGSIQFRRLDQRCLLWC